jgi:DNA-binding transcriptional MerR regulator
MKNLSIKKLYYSISEVSKITAVEQYVLRYWETEFEELKPQKNRAGNRIYTNKDIQLVLQIKSLLREKKYTIEGAKKILQNYIPELVVQHNDSPRQIDAQPLTHTEFKKDKDSIKKDLEEIKNIIEYLLVKL